MDGNDIGNTQLKYYKKYFIAFYNILSTKITKHIMHVNFV